MLGNIGTYVVPNQIAIGSGFQAFDEQHQLNNETQLKLFEGMIKQLVSTTLNHQS
tara:strand:+ start:59 stop:223 length:165 start_codon:yes stop_codon:yes gene_type:complete